MKNEIFKYFDLYTKFKKDVNKHPRLYNKPHYNMADSPNTLETKGLIYDLRQHYANIVGEHLRDAAEARKQDRYPEWFENLQDIYTIVHHKVAKDQPEIDEVYNSKLRNIAKLSQKYKDTWSNNTPNSQANAEFKHALRDLEMWIYQQMEEAKMFGEKLNEDEFDT